MSYRLRYWLCAAMVLSCCWTLAQSKRPVGSPQLPAEPSRPITIVPSDGFNLKVKEQISPNRLIVELSSTVHNWFAGTFTNLSQNGQTTIGLSMDGNDTQGN